MRPRGFALTEVLVAVAIAGVILTGLMALNVDYVALSRGAADLGEPYRQGDHLQRALAGDHRCDQPGAVLAARDDRVVLALGEQATDFITLSQGPHGSTISGGGASGQTPRQGRIVIANALQGDGAPRPGWGMAAVEAGDATIAVVALRCDLAEVCDYDTASGRCRGGK